METKKRILIFILVCVVFRLLLAYGAYLIHQNNFTYLRYALAIFFILTGINFLTFYLDKKFKYGGFGGPAYWKPYLPIHSMIYISFGLLFLMNYDKAYMLLVLDVLFGVGVFMNNYILQKNYK